jgi:hypothetical protein
MARWTSRTVWPIASSFLTAPFIPSRISRQLQWYIPFETKIFCDQLIPCVRSVCSGRLRIEYSPIRVLPSACTKPVPSQLPRRSAMTSDSQRRNGRDSTLSRLNLAIDALSHAKDVSTIAPAQAAFGSVCALLTILKVFCPPVPRRRAPCSHLSRTSLPKKRNTSN